MMVLIKNGIAHIDNVCFLPAKIPLS